LSNRRAQQKNPNFGTTNSFSLCTVNPNTSRISLFIPKNPQDVFIGVFSAGLEEPGLMTKSGGVASVSSKKLVGFYSKLQFFE
jgi:hypothetical protein